MVIILPSSPEIDLSSLKLQVPRFLCRMITSVGKYDFHRKARRWPSKNGNGPRECIPHMWRVSSIPRAHSHLPCTLSHLHSDRSSMVSLQFIHKQLWSVAGLTFSSLLSISGQWSFSSVVRPKVLWALLRTSGRDLDSQTIFNPYSLHKALPLLRRPGLKWNSCQFGWQVMN